MSFDPTTHYVPPGEFTMDLINIPGASDRYRIETEAEALPASRRSSLIGRWQRADSRADPADGEPTSGNARPEE